MTNKPNIFARGYRAMVDSFNYVAQQAEGEKTGSQQQPEIDDMQISYSDAKTLYLANPMARKLVDKPIEYAMSKRPVVEMPGCPDDLIDEVWREWDRLELDKVIATAQRNKKIYGASAIAMGIDGIPASYPVTAQVLRSNDVWFNAVDALQMAGNIFDLDANSRNYGRLKTFRLNGQVYPKGRYHFESNGEMVYLSFEGSNFNFAGRSAFRSIRTPLDAYKATFKAFKRIATLTGVLVHAAENSGANMGLSQKVRGQNLLSLKGLDQESVISVNQKDTITNLQFDHVEDAMKARMAIIQDIASGSGVPAQLLLEDSFAEALGSGNEDYRAVIQWLETYQSQEIELWYRWLMPVILTRVCTEKRFSAYAAAEPELSGTLHSEALQQWRDEMKFKWPKLIPQTDEELQDSKAKKLESIGIVFANTKDAQWYADEVNALELFANEVQEFEYVEPEPSGFGVDPAVAGADKTVVNNELPPTI
jgi:hypothetical protein